MLRLKTLESALGHVEKTQEGWGGFRDGAGNRSPPEPLCLSSGRPDSPAWIPEMGFGVAGTTVDQKPLESRRRAGYDQVERDHRDSDGGR